MAGASYPGPVKTLSVKLPEPLAQWLAYEANAVRRSRSEIVREALEAERAKRANGGQRRSLADALLEAGGPFQGPGDLNSNPKYWNDFGK
jgi:Arc/MetJ-type ribon-helix-helix transcriptional regulator